MYWGQCTEMGRVDVESQSPCSAKVYPVLGFDFNCGLLCAHCQTLYSNWIMKDHRNILAILEDLPSVNPAIDHVCELLPRLQARYYSISSSPKVSEML